MTRHMRIGLLIFAVLLALPTVVDATIQSLRKTVGVTITIVVTNPLGAVPHGIGNTIAIARGDAKDAGIAMQLVLNEREIPSRNYRAEQLELVGSQLVAQTTNQGSIRVEAEVSPNPNATLLYQNCGGISPPPPATVSGLCQSGGITIPVTAGVTTTVTCAYVVTINTTQALWTLYHGLFTDFVNTNTNAIAFTGASGDVKNSTYNAVPGPAFTPFVVYSDDGGVWAQVGTGSGSKSYCVDLKVLVPTSVLSGTYSSTAAYSLYY